MVFMQKLLKNVPVFFPHIRYNFSYKLNGGENTLTMEGSDCYITLQKGRKSMCTNYRPVCLTSIVCKLLESLIDKRCCAEFS